MKTRVLFLCTGNSCRSQMAEGLLRTYGGDRFEVFSAGTNPTSVNPFAIRTMHEVGIDISYQLSKSVDQFIGQHFDLVVTVCSNAQQQCPAFPGNCERQHWPLDDPADAKGTEEERMRFFRQVRDQLAAHIRQLRTMPE